ncbi:MAG: AAA family ATPase [Actinomycetota bacterium]|nr:AAA family ATPase [Actinomycetota bacterium]
MADNLFVPYVPRVALSLPDPGGPVAHTVEGSLLFVDVAGFTALSERLARRGRAGAEEVTGLIDATFGRLLAAAYADGGSLLKFGGDALLLLFTGDAHPIRAAHAAVGIRRGPRELGPLSTSVGEVRLRLSMGLHSGEVQLVLAGDVNRELVITGPGATEVVRMEKAAQGGEIVISPAAAERLPPTILNDAQASRRLLLRSPRAAQTSTPPPPDVRPASDFAPAWLRQHLRTSSGPEHRRVAISFVQFSGADTILHTGGPQSLAEAVHGLVSAAQTLADKYGVTLLGTDIDSDGGKLFLVAGAPEAREQREAALMSAVCALLDQPSPFALRAGITSGPAFVGDVGPSYRKTYTAMGDYVNLAARLMAHAAPGKVLTTPACLGPASASFESSMLPDIRVKGKSKPISIVGITPRSARLEERSGDVTVVGREAELETIRVALERAHHGRGTAIDLVGEAGVGKSHLLRGVEALAPDAARVRLAAEQYERNNPYGFLRRFLEGATSGTPMSDALVTDLEARGRIPPEQAAELRLILGSGEGHSPFQSSLGVSDTARDADERRRRRLARAVGEMLRAAFADRFTLVILEDLHWCDEASLEIVRLVVEAVEHGPWVVVGSRRPGSPALVDAGRPWGCKIELAGLDDAASAAVLANVADTFRPLSQFRRAQLLEKANGNPLFLIELARASSELSDEEELPDSVEALIGRQLDLLSGEAKSLLRDASVLGPRFPLDLLEAVRTDVEPCGESVWSELTGYLHRSSTDCRFEHALFRDVAYQALSFRRRRAIHQRAGEYLEARKADVALLALHFHEAEEHERAWRYGLLAGNRAAERSAHEEAAASYQRALAASRRAAVGVISARDLQDAFTRLGDSLYHAGHPDLARRAFRRARALSPLGPYGDPALLLREGQAQIALSRFPLALKWFSLGIRTFSYSPDFSVDLKSRLELARAGTRHRQGRHRECIRACDAIIDEETIRDGDPRILAHAYYLLHLALTTIGSPRRADYRVAALDTYRSLGDLGGQARTLNNLGFEAYYDGRWDEALRYYSDSCRCDEADGNPVGIATSLNNIAEILSDQGDWDAAREQFHRARQMFEAANEKLWVHFVQANLGRLETRAERYTEAGGYLETAWEGVSTVGAADLLPDVELRRAELALASGDVHQAEEFAGRAVTAGQSREMASALHRTRGAIALAQGNREAAHQAFTQAVAAAADFPYHRAVALLCLARVAKGPAERKQSHEEALRLLRDLGVTRLRLPFARHALVEIEDDRADAAAVAQ